MTSTSAAHITCLCGSIFAPGTLLEAQQLPIHLYICHCNLCRHATGTLGLAWPPLRSSPSPEIIAKCTAYQSSKKSTLYFCLTCGSQCFVSTYGKNWFCVAGIIEQTNSSKENGEPWPKDIIKISYHKYVSDTIDGGFTPFLLDLNGRSIPTWSGQPDASFLAGSYDFPHDEILSLSKRSTVSVQPEENSFLPAECRCGGVSLLVKRGNYTSNSSVQFSTRSLPSDTTKHLTYLCACRSCRLSSGASMTPWTLVPPSSVFNNNNSSNSSTPNDHLQTVTFKPSNSESTINCGLTLKHNWSSEDTCRSFCGVCGATVSYWCAKRPLEVDIAAGLFRAEEGSLARNWLEWNWGRCSFEEECVDDEMLEAWKGCEGIMREDKSS
ncbi:hypothetical protein VTL71DRAFT_11995 [Oculimacula yallundae]|uniref:CENP-V/GFA domain-containing protein n=1 Tax=Oculimacula yallundae TaxID=86028 RepID=A0ABR4CSA3_9HELO